MREMMEDTEFVTDEKWFGYAMRIEKRNLKERGSSLTFTGIARRARKYVIEIRDNGAIVRKGWRKAMDTEE
jgi:hypothetical protein